jgi:hypothetical protein
MSYEEDLSLGFNFNDGDRPDADEESAGNGAQEEDLADAESNADEDELSVSWSYALIYVSCCHCSQANSFTSSTSRHTIRARAISSALSALSSAPKHQMAPIPASEPMDRTLLDSAQSPQTLTPPTS